MSIRNPDNTFPQGPDASTGSADHASLAASVSGPILMRDFLIIEQMAHRNREHVYAREGSLFRGMTSEARQLLFRDIACNMALASRETQMRAISHFFRADVNYGVGAATALGIDLQEEMAHMNQDAGISSPISAPASAL